VRKKDSISALFWLFLSVLILEEGRKLPFGTPSHPMPGFVPFILGIILGILSLLLLGKSLFRGEKEEFRLLSGGKGLGRVGLTLGALLVYYLLLEPVGFLLVAFLLVFVLIKFIEPQRWIYSIWVSALVSLCAYFLFQVILKANLPQGIMKELSF
jgi:putative tricarboxylic transport membrane protein